MLANPDFMNEFDPAVYIELDAEGGQQRSDFMSGNFAWRQSVCLFLLDFVICEVRLTLSGLFKDIIYEEDPVNNDSCMFVLIVLGSDKTTVSVGTGDIEYHPLYFSLGPLHNSVRRAHRNTLIPIGFLAIPKSMYLISY